MFTGIVRERGRLVSREGGEAGTTLRVEAPRTAAATVVGDSVAVNGVCLTATTVEGAELAFEAVAETMRRTALGRLPPGGAVNLEPALRAGEPLGGHIVQGHVDGVGRVRRLHLQETGALLEVEAPPEILRRCVEKGSIAVDGVSLTIASLNEDSFEIALVPHTLAATTLGDIRAGHEVNLEADVLAKYVERALESRGIR